MKPTADERPIATANEAFPLISIVIPTYNHAHFLPRAVESALAQEYPAVEIVVVDDGSRDNTATVAAGFGDRILYVHQENQGLAGARNTGIGASMGEFLFFLDADDWMLPHTLSRLWEIMSRTGPDCGLVACLPSLIDVKDGVESEVPLPPVKDAGTVLPVTWTDLAASSRFPCTVLARTAAFDRCGLFDASYRHFGCEDRDMWLRIARDYQIRLLQERLVVLRYHGANMSSNPTRQLAGIRKLLGKARKMGVMPWWRLDFWIALASLYQQSASLLNSEAGRPGRAFFHACLSLAIWPLPGVRRWTLRGHFFRLLRLIATLRALLKHTAKKVTSLFRKQSTHEAC
jgi:glycosyltransferase involved in cell wall biosynthesis